MRLFKLFTLRRNRPFISSLKSMSQIPMLTQTSLPQKAQAIIKAAGGRFIAIGGVAGLGAKPVTGLQGTPPKRVTIQAWDSLDALKAWFNGADYQAALKIGEKYATFRRFAVEGQ